MFNRQSNFPLAARPKLTIKPHPIEQIIKRDGQLELGLPISRQIVEHYGGRMWLRSAPGQGACFGFDLPYKQEQ